MDHNLTMVTLLLFYNLHCTGVERVADVSKELAAPCSASHKKIRMQVSSERGLNGHQGIMENRINDQQ